MRPIRVDIVLPQGHWESYQYTFTIVDDDNQTHEVNVILKVAENELPDAQIDEALRQALLKIEKSRYDEVQTFFAKQFYNGRPVEWERH